MDTEPYEAPWCGSCIGCLSSLFAFMCGQRPSDLYEPLLLEDEKDAVTHLLQHIEHPQPGFLEGKSLRALRTLSYSDNADLQRSAAITFAEVTAKDHIVLTEAALEPILSLTHSPDIGVQRAVSAALGNLAQQDASQDIIVEMGGMVALVQLLHSSSPEVQCNACGCLTNLATTDACKARAGQAGALGPLVQLTNSHDQRVKGNAMGALLTLTSIESNRRQLVHQGVIPVFVSLLAAGDTDVQYYSAAALSNLAVDEGSRHSILQYNGGEALGNLVRLLASTENRVQCQACLCLRNLASDDNAQLAICERGGLAAILPILQSDNLELVSAAVAAVRNLSIHRENEAVIVRTGYISMLSALLMRMWLVAGYGHSPTYPMAVPCYALQPGPNVAKPTDTGASLAEEIECHCAGIVRNIASTDYRMQLYEEELVPLLANIIHRSPGNVPLVIEASAALSVICQHDALKYAICRLGEGQFCDLLINLMQSATPEVCFNATHCLANLACGGQKLGTHPIIIERNGLSEALCGLIREGDRGVPDAPIHHIALWLALQLSKGDIHARHLLISSGVLALAQTYRRSADVKAKQLAVALSHNLMSKADHSTSEKEPL